MPKILIVDDLASERLLLRSFLDTRGGLEIIEAVDGEAACVLARESQPDLIFLDIVLPKVDGFQVCRRLKKDPATSAIPVILVSSKTQESDRFWGLKQGAVDYLPKPLDMRQVLASVERLLAAPHAA